MDPAALLSDKIAAIDEANRRDTALALAPGATPAQQEARHNVAEQYCGIHFPQESAEALTARLARIDYAQPVCVRNVRGLDVENPKRGGFLGLGRKPAYFISTVFPPKEPDDPIYALEYYPVKS